MKIHSKLQKNGDGKQMSKRNVLIVLAIITLLTGIIRYRLLDVPLERDEGGFAYMAELILDGIPPYTQAYDYKPPGLYLMYAVFITIFGKSPTGIHTGLLLMNIGTMILIFLLARFWYDTKSAIVAVFLSQVLLVSSSLLGFAAHATHFVIFFCLLAYLVFEYLHRDKKWLKALIVGALLGCATLMKHSGVLFIIPVLIIPFLTRKEYGNSFSDAIKISGLIIIGFLVPLIGVLIWLGSTGALDGFLYWNLKYPSIVAKEVGTSDLFPRIYRNGIQAAGSFLPVWILSIVCFLYYISRSRGSKARSRVVLFSIFSFAAVFIGYETRSHYFVLIIPAVAIVIGITVSYLVNRLKSQFQKVLIFSVPFILTIIGIIYQSDYFFTADPAVISRTIYYPNQFADAEKVAGFIQSRTNDSDRIAILGSEPEILFLSGRRSATRYIFTNFFHEKHNLREKMESEMIREIDSVKPAIIVMINQPFSWGALPRGNWPILIWAKGYLDREYELIGTVKLVSVYTSVFKWDKDARDDPGALASQIMIFRRNDRSIIPGTF